MMSDKPWWARLPARLLAEETELAGLRATEPPISKAHRWVREGNGEPRVRVVLAPPVDAYELEIRFPPHYPDGCPSVRPVPYDKPISSHQFTSSGVFCLELGPDNWHPRYTAADMVKSAWRLLVLETLGPLLPREDRVEIPSRHVSDVAERVRLGDGVLVETRSFSERLLQAGPDLLEFEYVWSDRHLLKFCAVSFPKGSPLGDVPPALLRTTKYTGVFGTLGADAPSDVPDGRAEFDAFVERHLPTRLPDTALLVVLRWASGRTQAFVRFAEKVRRLVSFPIQGDATERTPSSLLAAAGQIRVGIVGMGSLGSKVAISLARTGVRRFVLVDSDVLEGANLCRHAAGFDDVGALKGDAMRQVLRDVTAAEPEVVTHAISLASATHPELHARVLEDLGAADVLIDATANPDAFGLIAMIASNKRRPVAWGEVFGGGLGGLVASAHPDRDPCPRCVRSAFLAKASTWPPAPSTSAALPYEGGGTQPIVATDADVSMIASALTRRVLDLISNADDSRPAVVLLGGRRGWVFDSALQSIGVDARSDDWNCPRCWTPDEAPDPETLSAAEALFSGHVDDSAVPKGE
jgi:molybdopterin/thiamine biosynthesis adenylyltransferase